MGERTVSFRSFVIGRGLYGLGKLLRSSERTDEELSSNENDHGGLGGRSGLSVHGGHSVLDLLERETL